jgi:diaminopimelate epimerase
VRQSIPAFPFVKMEGCGNDFVVITKHDLPAGARPDWARTLCDRRFGVGADGVLVVGEPGDLPQDAVDFGAIGSMEVWNADGSVAEMCGNGVRCVVLHLLRAGRWDGKGPASLLTGAGLVRVRSVDGEFEVEMGPPRDPLPPSIPTLLTCGAFALPLTPVSMGNPHAVLWEDEAPPALLEFAEWAPLLGRHPFFPEGVNVEWARVLDEHTVRLRVWERGVGETLACGSGACATVVAARVTGRLPAARVRKGVDVHLPGGRLVVSWAGRASDPVTLRGPARAVFQGHWRNRS